jgi:hypothetical protein
MHPSAWKGNSPKFAAWKGFEDANFFRDDHRGFIAAGYGNGGVGLPSLSSSFSFPELLVGFPMAHPALLALFLMRVCGG